MTLRRALLASLLALGCGDSSSEGRGRPDAPGGGGTADAPAAAATFVDCRERPFALAPGTSWRHTSSALVAASGDPNHSAQDQVVVPGGTASLPGKFTYGTLSSDLEDEDVRVFLDDCGGWRDLGTFPTDRDGRISAPVGDVPGPGVYEARFEVLGDRSTTISYLWVLPVGTRIVVSDIDGTMTQSDAELFQQMFDGSHVPVPYPGAVDLTVAHRQKGWVVFYLTGRPYWLTQVTRAWLRDLAFTPGPLRVTDNQADAVPVEGGVGDYKTARLLEWQQAYAIDYAYGNASTDIYAYLGAGLPAGDVWIIGDHAGEQGTNFVDGSWVPRVGEVNLEPSVTQAFRW